jgi:hypothetical protein
MKDPKSFKRFVTDKKLEMLVAEYHLKPSGGYEYRNEAGDPVRIRTANIAVDGKDYRFVRFDLPRDVHDRLVAAGGYYLFVLYRLNRYGSDLIVKHGIRPASDFEVSGNKVAKVHVSAVFEGVEE